MTTGPGRGVVGDFGSAFDALVDADPGITRSVSADGAPYFHVTDELLIPTGDAARAVDFVRRNFDVLNIDPVRSGESFPAPGVELLHLHGNAPVDIGRLVDALRNADQPIHATPHHVVFGCRSGNVMGHPDGPPEPVTGPITRPRTPTPYPDTFRIGICDTGICAPPLHDAWFGGLYVTDVNDIDDLYKSGTKDQLDLESGHGTFIAGVIQQVAPGMPFDPACALNDRGIGNEATVAKAIRSLDPAIRIINLSLGCPTKDRIDAIGMSAAIDALDPEVVVVAAAGNTNTSEPHYPAALPRVIGVGATEVVGGVVVPAPYSNFGKWIKVWAPGRFTSTFATGELAIPSGSTQTFSQPWATWAGTSFAAPYVAAWIARTAFEQSSTPRQVADGLLTGLPTFGSGVVLA